MILYTSDERFVKYNLAKTSYRYQLATLACALFGAVYETFSHGVYSNYMLYAFLFPLVLGALPFAAFSLFGRTIPNQLACRLYHAGVSTLSIGSIMSGVLEIYGTTSTLLSIYWVVGSGFILLGLLLFLVSIVAASKTRE